MDSVWGTGLQPARGLQTRATVALRLSAGELVFDENIDVSTREAVREMWVNRLAGFNRLNLSQYLRDSVESMRYVKDGRTYSFKTYRRMCRVLFPLQRIGALFGVTLTAEALDAHVSREDDPLRGGDSLRGGERIVTRCYLVLMLAGWIFRQSRLAMAVVCRSGDSLRGGDWVWIEAADETIPRRCWPYVRHCSRDGRTWFTTSRPEHRTH